MAESTHKKVTVSLQKELVAYADEIARKSRTTRSGVIADLLVERRARERAELAREGYRFYGGEASEFDVAAGGAVAEAWDHDGETR
jgi:metal-responsive CopG/Arc/MetJ family transcriptional regulator